MELLKKVRPNLKLTLCWFWNVCLAWVRTAAPAPSNLPANIFWADTAAVRAFAITRAKTVSVSTSQRDCRSLYGLACAGACCTVAITRYRNIAANITIPAARILLLDSLIAGLLTINITAVMTMSTPMVMRSIRGVAGGHLTERKSGLG